MTGEVPTVFTGPLTPGEIMECDALVKTCAVNVGALRNGVCVDTAAFLDIETAEEFLRVGVWPDADAVVLLPEECGIGDVLDGETWVKRESQKDGIDEEEAGAV